MRVGREARRQPHPRSTDDHSRDDLCSAVGAWDRRRKICHRQPAAAALVGCGPGRTAGIVCLAATKRLGSPIVWTLYGEFYIYAHSSDPYLPPGAILNPLLDALEAALAPSPATGIQHLGLPEMVQHAYITGRIETDQGVLGDQAIAIVPIEVLCI